MNTQKLNSTGARPVIVTAKRRGSSRKHAEASPMIVRMAVAQAEGRAAHRHAMTAEAAYLRAQKRGFMPGHELEDWLSAELEVEAAERLSVLCPSDPATPAEKAAWEARQN